MAHDHAPHETHKSGTMRQQFGATVGNGYRQSRDGHGKIEHPARGDGFVRTGNGVHCRLATNSITFAFLAR